MIAEIISLSLPGLMFIVCASFYVAHTIHQGKKILVAKIIALSIIFLMYVSVVLINIVAYIKVHHPSENMDIYQVVGTDIYFDSVDGTYIKIEKHPFRIHNPYTISDVSEVQ